MVAAAYLYYMRNWTTMKRLYIITATPESLLNLQDIVDSWNAGHSTDFTVHPLAVYRKYPTRLTSNPTLTQTAEYHRDRAIALSPDNRSVVENGFRDYTPSGRIIR